MNTIFIIDLDIKECLGSSDFVPRREERILLDGKEYKVSCVLYHPEQNATLVFVKLVDRYYSDIIKDIKWT